MLAAPAGCGAYLAALLSSPRLATRTGRAFSFKLKGLAVSHARPSGKVQ